MSAGLSRAAQATAKDGLESSFAHVLQAMQRNIAAESAVLRAKAEPDPDLRGYLTRKAERRQHAAALTLEATADEFCQQVRDLCTNTMTTAVAAMETAKETVSA